MYAVNVTSPVQLPLVSGCQNSGADYCIIESETLTFFGKQFRPRLVQSKQQGQAESVKSCLEAQGPREGFYSFSRDLLLGSSLFYFTQKQGQSFYFSEWLGLQNPIWCDESKLHGGLALLLGKEQELVYRPFVTLGFRFQVLYGGCFFFVFFLVYIYFVVLYWFPLHCNIAT